MAEHETNETYSVPETSKVLRLSERRVQQLLQRGQLSGTKLDDGRWLIPKHVVHAYRDETQSKRTVRPSKPLEGTRRYETLIRELRSLERHIGRLEGQRELQAVAESTLREQLERERERASTAEQRADRLEAELIEARKPWYRRWFGS